MWEAISPVICSPLLCCQAWSPFVTAPTPRLCAPSPMATPSCPLGARWWTAARRARRRSSLTRPTAPRTACCPHLWPSMGWRCPWPVISTVLPAASMTRRSRRLGQEGRAWPRISLQAEERWVRSGAGRHRRATCTSWTSSSWVSCACSWSPSDCCSPCCCSSSCWQSLTWTLPSSEISAKRPNSSSSTLSTSALCGAGSPVSYDGWAASSSASEALINERQETTQAFSDDGTADRYGGTRTAALFPIPAQLLSGRSSCRKPRTVPWRA